MAINAEEIVMFIIESGAVIVLSILRCIFTHSFDINVIIMEIIHRSSLIFFQDSVNLLFLFSFSFSELG